MKISPKNTLRTAVAASFIALGLAACTPPSSGGPTPPPPKATHLTANLTALNDSGSSGWAKLTLVGDKLTVRIHSEGLVPNSPHAQHIHGVGESRCPIFKDAGPNGFITTSNGLPAYGPIVASLTVKGDTSPNAALDVADMPKADANGRLDYNRTITLPSTVSHDLTKFAIVQHGVDANGSGVYDFDLGPSDLDPTLPQEATAPANCSRIMAENTINADHMNMDHMNMGS